MFDISISFAFSSILLRDCTKLMVSVGSKLNDFNTQLESLILLTYSLKVNLSFFLFLNFNKKLDIALNEYLSTHRS